MNEWRGAAWKRRKRAGQPNSNSRLAQSHAALNGIGVVGHLFCPAQLTPQKNRQRQQKSKLISINFLLLFGLLFCFVRPLSLLPSLFFSSIDSFLHQLEKKEKAGGMGSSSLLAGCLRLAPPITHQKTIQSIPLFPHLLSSSAHFVSLWAGRESEMKRQLDLLGLVLSFRRSQWRSAPLTHQKERQTQIKLPTIRHPPEQSKTNQFAR